MQSVRVRDTPLEVAVRKRIHSKGLRYFVHRAPLPNWRRTADIVFPRLRLAVFIDGCYWHACPIHRVCPKSNTEWWQQKFEATRRRDAETSRILLDSGWQVLRFWEHENPDDIAARIHEAVSKLQGHSGGFTS